MSHPLHRNAHRRRPPAAGGTAYLSTLLAIVVLTILGLSVALSSQTEMQIGKNELTMQRVFYASDSGVSLATARALVERDFSPISFSIDDPDTGRLLAGRHRISISRYLEVNRQFCDLCDSANYGSHHVDEVYDLTFLLTSVGSRRLGPADKEIAAKTISTMMEFQPLKPAASMQTEQLKKNTGTLVQP